LATITVNGFFQVSDLAAIQPAIVVLRLFAVPFASVFAAPMLWSVMLLTGKFNGRIKH
jgi:hypothetical protein